MGSTRCRAGWRRGTARTLVTLILAATPGVAAAQEGHAGAKSTSGAEAHAHNRHYLDLFLGPASGANPSENGLAIGPTYRWHFKPRVSLAVLGDAAFYDTHTTTTLLAGPFVNLTRAWLLGVGAGVEHANQHYEEHEGEDVGGTDAAFRVETSYGFFLGQRWELSPTLAVDFIGSHRTALFGVSIGRGF